MEAMSWRDVVERRPWRRQVEERDLPPRMRSWDDPARLWLAVVAFATTAIAAGNPNRVLAGDSHVDILLSVGLAGFGRC